jgi:hypothetical protein
MEEAPSCCAAGQLPLTEVEITAKLQTLSKGCNCDAVFGFKPGTSTCIDCLCSVQVLITVQGLPLCWQDALRCDLLHAAVRVVPACQC